ncbi:aminopeptidase P family protein [Actibacterium pelagium]|uniref:Xaa-Pro aminopeptidase n=1 Tax=Actibacterium pelagium TaxID=2029103 RepID=A0A917EKD6_9RHOB|nr:aminopeptidase P family protein [Actibacterium pelagium]GGE47194.1 Xaa-Pro aminopeptidase [Actibacterium pelagium]
MFQSFTATASPEFGPKRLAALRAAMAEAEIDAVIIPRADAHQGEYVASCDQRLAWLTGFTGSAGFAVVTMDEAGVFVDGRYRAQVRVEVDLDHFTPVPWPEVQLTDWIAERLSEGAIVAFDPWLHTVEQVQKLAERFDPLGIETGWEDLIAQIWDDRPARPAEPLTVYPENLAGRSLSDKCDAVAKDLRDAGHSAAVLTLPDSICWLLNIRGADIPRIPIMHAFAVIHADGTVDLCTDAPAGPEVQAALTDRVRLHPYDALLNVFETLEGQVRLDPQSAPIKLWAFLGGRAALDNGAVAPVEGKDPCQLPKACKTEAEIAGARAAHLRDAAAVCEFLCWLDTEAPKGGLTEIDVATRLEQARVATGALKDISFETIAGAGPNGAIVHYRVNEKTNRPVKTGELLLIDSGGQYLDGTTDITRTVAVGEVGEEEKTCFTRVLRGMIAISMARFPKGLAGRDLDALARMPLWQAGQDYDHGTGHGVGSYLSVHEGPQRLSRISHEPLRPGMIVSNEPGYYREGAFGIRIENLVTVTKAADLPGADAREMLTFETLTYVPIDRRLIVAEMLSPAELAWINDYHATVEKKLSKTVPADICAWLKSACAPL